MARLRYFLLRFRSLWVFTDLCLATLIAGRFVGIQGVPEQRDHDTNSITRE